ncbi:ATP-binding protein [Moraxella nasovis]|uniref:ATP-binding protein n=1 Tax=Moraxella nasovis TaxID=2904121 RepID=UPI001F60F201|nr:ATP-binding protein [Moraxella nasovis]UNU72711.1 ATP-binding protein [Moraxella nasovis]
MEKFLISEKSIFFRIYAGLVLLCISVALFAYGLTNLVNQKRLQSYRENMSSGIFYLISQGVTHQENEIDRAYWLADASSFFGEEFNIIPINSVSFTKREIQRLNSEKTVVQAHADSSKLTFYHRIEGESNLLTVSLSQVGERQVRAMTIFLLDDLSYFPTMNQKQARLKFLEKKFGIPFGIYPIKHLGLDLEQIGRLRRDEPVMLFRDGDSIRDTTLSVVMASQLDTMAIVIGPAPLFKWFPLNLLISIVLLSMMLISLGVYGLILPLEKRLRLLQAGVDRVTKGDLDTKIEVIGRDDVAKLAYTFNVMTYRIKRLIESQRELTRAVSHELRTPVARIRFAVEMLADDDDYESRQSQKAYIDEDIESLNKLIDEILTHAKLEEGVPTLDWQMVKLADLVTRIERETNALGKSITVRTVLPSVKVAAMADLKLLHRVVQNFAGNAMRYAKSTIIISAGVKSGMAFVSVEDDGQGIPKADREKVFVPFARLDDSRTRASGGYGLGLAIVSRIAFWFNATVTVDDSPELGGARFIMTWPVKQAGVKLPKL